MDRIAKEGIKFDRCLVTNSICGPSRATILIGKHSHLNGFYSNSDSKFDLYQTCFPSILQDAGYQTAMTGKWYLHVDPVGFNEWDILPGQGFSYNPPMISNGKNVKRQSYATDTISDLSIG